MEPIYTLRMTVSQFRLIKDVFSMVATEDDEVALESQLQIVHEKGWTDADITGTEPEPNPNR